MDALHKIIKKGSYDTALEYVVWRFWLTNLLPGDRETVQKAADELAALEAVAEAAQKIKQQCLESANRNDWFSNHENGEYHLGKADAYRDVAQRLDALKNIESR